MAATLQLDSVDPSPVPAALTRPRRAFAYIRVSLAREIMVSPEQQKTSIDDHAARNDKAIVDYVIETDKSGRTFAKRRIAELIERVRAGEADEIIVWKFSRFGRNAAACGVHNDALNKAGGILVSATQHVDTSTPYGAFFLRMYFSMDELESDVIGMGWKETHERRLNAGLPHTGMARFGYQRCEHCERDPENQRSYKWCKHCKGVLVVDPVRGPALAEAYKRWVDGEPLGAIAKDFREQGILSRNNKPISPHTLRNTMDSGFAAGLIRHRTDAANGKAVCGRPDQYDQWLPGIHEALIPMELWNRYKSKRLDGAAPASPRATHVWKYSVSGLLKCGSINHAGEPCGRTLNIHHIILKGERVPQFRCPAHEDQKSCPGVTILLSRAEGLLLDWVRGFATPDGEARAAYREAAQNDKRAGELAGLSQEISSLQRKIKRNKDAYLGEAIDLDEFRATRDELLAELSLRQNRKQMIEAAINAAGPPPPEEIQPMLNYWGDLTPHTRRLAFGQLIRTVTAYSVPGRRPTRLEIVAHWDPVAE